MTNWCHNAMSRVIFVCVEEHRKELKAAHDRELQAKAIVAMNGRLRTWTMLGHKDTA